MTILSRSTFARIDAAAIEAEHPTGKECNVMQKPAWAKRMDVVNFTIIGIVMAVVVWETISRLLHR